MMDWLKVCNKADIIPFIEAIDKIHQQYYPDEIDMLKDVVSIPGILMTYVLNKPLKMKQPGELESFAPGQPCFHKCEECEVDPKPGCERCNKVWNDCMQCAKSKAYELLKTAWLAAQLSSSVISRVWKVLNLQLN